jgi:hypothetical protein
MALSSSVFATLRIPPPLRSGTPFAEFDDGFPEVAILVALLGHVERIEDDEGATIDIAQQSVRETQDISHPPQASWQ